MGFQRARATAAGLAIVAALQGDVSATPTLIDSRVAEDWILTPGDLQQTPEPGGASPWNGKLVSVQGVVTAISPHGRFYYVSGPAGGAAVRMFSSKARSRL